MKKRSETVTAADCDWSFLEIAGVMEAFTAYSRKCAKGRAASADDVFQEAVLFFAVRPDRTKQILADGGVALLAFKAQTVMKDRNRTANDQADHDQFEVLVDLLADE